MRWSSRRGRRHHEFKLLCRMCRRMGQACIIGIGRGQSVRSRWLRLMGLLMMRNCMRLCRGRGWVLYMRRTTPNTNPARTSSKYVRKLAVVQSAHCPSPANITKPNPWAISSRILSPPKNKKFARNLATPSIKFSHRTTPTENSPPRNRRPSNNLSITSSQPGKRNRKHSTRIVSRKGFFKELWWRRWEGGGIILILRSIIGRWIVLLRQVITRHLVFIRDLTSWRSKQTFLPIWRMAYIEVIRLKHSDNLLWNRKSKYSWSPTKTKKKSCPTINAAKLIS